MQDIQLTEIQQQWFTHFNQSQEQTLSMSAYAKQNGLSLKAFYNAQKVLVDKGVVQPASATKTLLPINVPCNAVANEMLPLPYRINLVNGVVVELPATDLVVLLQMASQL